MENSFNVAIGQIRVRSPYRVDMSDTMSDTKSATIADIVAMRRHGFEQGVTRPIAWRTAQLDAMEAMLREHSDDFATALHSDLRKAPTEAWTTEIGFTLSDIDHQRKHLGAWSRSRKVRIPLLFRPGTARIVPEPKGVVLIIAPWNYPLQLLLAPMAAAIAAGNAIVAKPSELAPATSALLVDLCARYLDPTAISVIGGGIPESTALLEQRFDHIFFTGGTKVGKIVMHAAAEHLTPVTLELGGKSPAIVAADADIGVAARRIAWGKFTNAGQTCIAPDYVLVDRTVRDELVAEIAVVLGEFYGADPATSDDYGRIVSDDHAARLSGLLADEGSGTVAIGGSVDLGDRYIAPTVLVEPDPTGPLMQEEIFGPLLPLLGIDDADEAIAFVNDRAKPLALYVFSNDDDLVERVIRGTSSGGVGVNATLLHIAPPELPFGGVGPSGMGAYHGRTGFETFSHLKSVYDRRVKPDPSVMYPPYTSIKRWLIKLAH
ncbi:MAG: aldehyde dehydrogenase family protein [Ilumatobacteraceae bacterium]